ncbi:Golgi apparatus membrane protein-like protein [Hapsidospora chrysogenum ATCC 11550]|uniref:Golgi apparatus membrane protein-like protein n=1 Tax=Hapsidospora chrysogenum (strain ATCC 11550 / CBS 779.69 / DSM 880 / IAM 14645 / JCM 23072 / IMI 49137) TaxID=857340 RepID=A0A086TEA8_HAPC1|nr:Golgi apparatus membrane protein-like protein [Hapsidospora chrysogenum ATCC 11550]
MELSDIFRIVNLAVGTITALGGIVSIFHFGLNSSNIIVGAYLIIFGLCIALLEFQIPPQVSRYASFLFSLIGRGAFYIFLGGLILGNSVLSKIAGSTVGIVGIGFVILEYVPSIEAPINMREAEVAGWGAEQV